jgi:hypothetical protein
MDQQATSKILWVTWKTSWAEPSKSKDFLSCPLKDTTHIF